MDTLILANAMLFLSTLSLRRATFLLFKVLVKSHDFYPRSPCGERRKELFLVAFKGCISIHALLAESDRKTIWTDIKLFIFLSTLSLRRAT